MGEPEKKPWTPNDQLRLASWHALMSVAADVLGRAKEEAGAMGLAKRAEETRGLQNAVEALVIKYAGK